MHHHQHHSCCLDLCIPFMRFPHLLTSREWGEWCGFLFVFSWECNFVDNIWIFIYDHFSSIVCIVCRAQRKHICEKNMKWKRKHTNTAISNRPIDFRFYQIQRDLNLMKKKTSNNNNDIHTTSWRCRLAQQEKPVFSNFQTACDLPRFGCCCCWKNTLCKHTITAPSSREYQQ